MGRQQLVGAEAQALHHAGPEALEQHVRPSHQRPYDVEVGGVLQVEGDGALAAVEQRRRP
jgi:hypothetical protein